MKEKKPAWLKSRFANPEIPDYGQLRDWLSMVSRMLPRNVFNTWTDKQKFLALEWAIAWHLKASDNVIYKPPKEPAWVKKLRRIK